MTVLKTALAATAALSVMAATAPAGAREGVQTAVASFSWTDSDGDTDFFDGAVTSAQQKCVKRRRVALYRKLSGPDRRVASTTTDRDGGFVIEREDPGSGRYYVEVKRKRVDALVCKAVASGDLQVTDLDGV